MTCSSPLTMTYHRPNGQSTPEKLPIFRRKNCLRTPTHGRVVTWVGERVWQLWNSNYRWFSSWESDDYLTWGFKMLILTSAWSCDILQPTNMVFQMRLTTKNPPCGEVKKQLYIYVCVSHIIHFGPCYVHPRVLIQKWQSYPAPQKHILRQARGMIGAALTEAWERGSAKRDVKMGTDS